MKGMFQMHQFSNLYILLGMICFDHLMWIFKFDGCSVISFLVFMIFDELAFAFDFDQNVECRVELDLAFYMFLMILG